MGTTGRYLPRVSSDKSVRDESQVHAIAFFWRTYIFVKKKLPHRVDGRRGRGPRTVCASVCNHGRCGGIVLPLLRSADSKPSKRAKSAPRRAKAPAEGVVSTKVQALARRQGWTIRKLVEIGATKITYSKKHQCGGSSSFFSADCSHSCPLCGSSSTNALVYASEALERASRYEHGHSCCASVSGRP